MTLRKFALLLLLASPCWAQVLQPGNGGTGVAYFGVAGPTTARTYTFPDANSTMVRLVASGTATINPGATSSNTCSSAIDGGTATGVLTT